MALVRWLFVLPLLLLCYDSYGVKKWTNQWVQGRLRTNPNCALFRVNELRGTCNNTNLMMQGFCRLSTTVGSNPSAKALIEKAFRKCYLFNKPIRLRTTAAPANETTSAAPAIANSTSSTTSTTTSRTTTTTRRFFR